LLVNFLTQLEGALYERLSGRVAPDESLVLISSGENTLSLLTEKLLLDYVHSNRKHVSIPTFLSLIAFDERPLSRTRPTSLPDELITADDLDDFNRHRQAQELLPQIVLRLLRATPGVTSLSGRVGDGIQYSDFDARVVCQRPSPYVPDGESVWEFKTGRNAKRNLKGLITFRDIRKKKQHPNAAKDDQGRLRVGAALGLSADSGDRLKALIAAAGATTPVIDTIAPSKIASSSGLCERYDQTSAPWTRRNVFSPVRMLSTSDDQVFQWIGRPIISAKPWTLPVPSLRNPSPSSVSSNRRASSPRRTPAAASARSRR